MASFGFGMVAFFRTIVEKSPSKESLRLHQGAIRIGVALILLGIVASGLAYWSTLRRLRRGETPVRTSWPMSITVAMLSAVIGLARLWELFAHGSTTPIEKPRRDRNHPLFSRNREAAARFILRQPP